MAWHAFAPHVAVDPNNGELVTEGFGYVVPLDAEDGASALDVTDLSGNPFPSGLVPIISGLVAGFRVEDHLAVEWVAGNHRVPIWSPAVYEAAATAAAETAVAAAGPSTDPSNLLSSGSDGRLYLGNDTVVTPAGLVATLEDDGSAVRTVLDGLYVVAGSYSRALVLAADAEIPEGTPAGTIVLRLPGDD